MNKYGFLFVSCVVLVGCSGPDGSKLEAPTGSAITGCHQAFYSPLPDPSIELKFPFHIRLDRIYKKNKNEVRRGLSLEYLDGTVESIGHSVSTSLASAGYTLRSGTAVVTGKGVYKYSFEKLGYPSIHLEVSGNVGSKPSNPGALGVVWMSWAVNDDVRQGTEFDS